MNQKEKYPTISSIIANDTDEPRLVNVWGTKDPSIFEQSNNLAKILHLATSIDKSDLMFVIMERDKVLGAIWCELSSGLFTLAVDPAERSKGYARKLLEALIKNARRYNIKVLKADAVHPHMESLVNSLRFNREEEHWVKYL